MAQSHAGAHTASSIRLETAARGFIAGFAATLVFHQGMLSILHSSGLAPMTVFDMQSTQPFGVPHIWSLAFWGGIWGIGFAWIVGHLPPGKVYWLDAVAFGAVAPTLVAWFIVDPIKGLPPGNGWHAAGIVTALLVNGAWGLGTGLFMRLGHERLQEA
jgi:hypothetical protein